MNEQKEEPIKRYNARTARLSQGKSEGSPMLSISATGGFRLNAPALVLIRAKVGDGVELLHDTMENEWYLAITNTDGLPLRKNKNGCAQFASMILYRRMLPSLPDSKGAFLLAQQHTLVAGTKAWAILLSSSKSAS